jgi:hypothetical protein
MTPSLLWGFISRGAISAAQWIIFSADFHAKFKKAQALRMTAVRAHPRDFVEKTGDSSGLPGPLNDTISMWGFISRGAISVAQVDTSLI